MRMFSSGKLQKLALAVFVIGVAGLLAYGFGRNANGGETRLTTSDESKSTHTLLLLEIFDSIKKNYWDTVDERKLIQLFELAVTKVASTSPLTLSATSTRAEFADYLTSALSAKTESDKKAATLAIGELVLSNLPPFGRNRLFTMAQEKDLRDTVSNIDASKDLYAELGVKKGASVADIDKAYQAKLADLRKEDTPGAKEKITRISYIKDVLTDEKKKALYDSDKIEPTLSLKALSRSTFYLNLTKFSPTTLQEFTDAATKMGGSVKARNLIIDMRGNIGGSFDIVPYLSGFFIGPSQYAFDLFKQGAYIPFKTPTQKLPPLSGLRRIIVLIDGNTQSSAELFVTVLKKYNKAKVIGTRSKGWGTIENTFPLATGLYGDKYTLFLVHSMTVGENGQPIEGRGVDPDIDITDKNWRATARDEFEDSALVSLLESLFII